MTGRRPRWCDAEENWFETNAERADRLIKWLRAMGVDPDAL